ncbi:hypothetical protein PG984_013012 [Apiospora sp. TS-2023a]
MDLSASPLLRLPRELRNAIYRAYVLVDGGYVLDPHAKKLRKAKATMPSQADGSNVIDLSLMYTCRQVASEMRGVALGANLVTFKPVYSEELRLRAGRYLELMDALYHHAAIASAFAYNVCKDRARGPILAKYPWFGPYLDQAVAQHNQPRGNTALLASDTVDLYSMVNWKHGSRIRVQSLVRQAMLFTLEVCFQQPTDRDTI